MSDELGGGDPLGPIPFQITGQGAPSWQLDEQTEQVQYQPDEDETTPEQLRAAVLVLVVVTMIVLVALAIPATILLWRAAV